MAMRSIKIVQVHQRIIKKSQRYINFVKKVPMFKMLRLNCYTLPIQEGKAALEEIHCICKVIGFNKDSVRVRVIAAEKIFHPLSELLRKQKRYQEQEQGSLPPLENSLLYYQRPIKKKDITDSHIKLGALKNYGWQEIDRKDLPLYIGYEFKSILFEEMLK